MRKLNSILIALIAMGALQASWCSPDKQPAPQTATAQALARLASTPTFTLDAFFDGGYVYDFAVANAIEVHALQSANFPMKVRVLTSGNQEIPLAGYTVTFRPDGIAPAAKKPDFPPLDESATGCTNNDTQPSKRNNRLFIPDLDQVAAGMGTSINHAVPKATTVHLTGGGALSIADLGGCVEFRNPDGTPWKSKRSMASGIEGILYEWLAVPGSTLTLVRTDSTGRETTDVLQPNGQGRIVLRFSSFQSSPPPQTPPYEIAHFKTHFAGLFTSVTSGKWISLWWLGTYRTSPGIDCPPGSTGP